MIKALVSRFRDTLAKASNRNEWEGNYPIKIWFENDPFCTACKKDTSKEFVFGETSKFGENSVEFVTPSIRIDEKYFVGEQRTVCAEIDAYGKRIAFRFIGAHYEQVGEHHSTAQFKIAAKVIDFKETSEGDFSEIRRSKRRNRSGGNLKLGVDEL